MKDEKRMSEWRLWNVGKNVGRAGIRTLNPWIDSQRRYRLNYQGSDAPRLPFSYDVVHFGHFTHSNSRLKVWFDPLQWTRDNSKPKGTHNFFELSYVCLASWFICTEMFIMKSKPVKKYIKKTAIRTDSTLSLKDRSGNRFELTGTFELLHVIVILLYLDEVMENRFSKWEKPNTNILKQCWISFHCPLSKFLSKLLDHSSDL